MEIYPRSTVAPIDVPGHQLSWRFPILLGGCVFAATVLLPVNLLAHDFEGRITVAGPIPVAPAIPVGEKHAATCGKEQVSPSLIVGEGGLLENAVVSLEPLHTYEVDKADNRLHTYEVSNGPMPVLDQKNCRFSPHILMVKTNEPFQITNLDPMDHDVRIFSGSEILLRFEMSAFEKPAVQKFEKSGTYVIRCGLHKWMHAFVLAIPHPFYALTGPDGTFQLKGIPEGKYKLKVWHETLGEHEESIEISKSIGDFSFTFDQEKGA